MLVRPTRAGAFLVPDAGDAPFLPDPGLVHEPELDPPRRLRMLGGDLLHQAGQGFLNRSCAPGSASGWTDRAF